MSNKKVNFGNVGIWAFCVRITCRRDWRIDSDIYRKKKSEDKTVMYKMRRKDRQLGNEDTIEILQHNQYGILSTVDKEGMPYGVPLTYVYDEGKIYFHSAVEGHKLDNINFNKKVSFCVVGPTEILPEQFSTRYESAIAFGEVHELIGEEKIAVLMKVVERYSPEFREKEMKYIKAAEARARVFCINVDRMTGKSRK